MSYFCYSIRKSGIGKFSCQCLFYVMVLYLCTPLSLFAQVEDGLKLKNYRPVSIYRIPQTKYLTRARFPVIDFHAHDYAQTDQEVDEWVKTMNEVGVAKTIILSKQTGAAFDSIVKKYSRYPDRFEIWCGFDYTGYDQPGWQQHAVAELERCYKMGARGVGELGDKGLGELYSRPVKGKGMHIDDPRLKPLLNKCAELGMPVSIHVAEDEWNYLPMDSANDGLFNAALWKVDLTQKGILGHDALIQTLENAVRDNPRVTFIACHLANCITNLTRLLGLLDDYPNLYADISARYAEMATIPRYVKTFMERYQDRLVYGTDMGNAKRMYHLTYRILESPDEHFYDHDYFPQHYPLYGMALSDGVLEKLYNGNGKKLSKSKSSDHAK